MPLTIKPPQPPSPEQTPNDITQSSQVAAPSDPAPSPTAPDFSPITPKVNPSLPVLNTGASQTLPSTNVEQLDAQPQADGAQVPQPAIPPTQYIPQPPTQPFSSDESSDGLALRAAISALQFQRQKAQEDLKSLDQIRHLALTDPEAFMKDLVAGRLKEKRHKFGSLEEFADLQETESGQEHVTHMLGQAKQGSTSATALPPIPGPQNVVRMPYINWEKYHVVGEALDSLHDQQRRWPGTAPSQQDRGREAAVMAPYSPFHDAVDEQARHSRNSSDTSKKDSLISSSLAATSTALEHPYETRRSSSKYHT